jgi:hypothetical protein
MSLNSDGQFAAAKPPSGIKASLWLYFKGFFPVNYLFPDEVKKF